MSMQTLKSIKTSFAVLLCSVLSVSLAKPESPEIQIFDSWTKENKSGGTTSLVRLKMQAQSNSEELGSQIEIILENSCKNINEKPLVFRNTTKTIIGFNSSIARVNYKINLIWLTDKSEMIVDQNLNLPLAEMLRKERSDAVFDSSGLYLSNIVGQMLYIGFKSDSGKGLFTFQVKVNQDGTLRFVSDSFLMEG